MVTDTQTKNQVDAELVQKSLQSSDQFGLLIKKYQEPLRRYVRRMSRPTPDELDILLQDIFIKIYENLNDFDQSLSFSSWIYRIAHNESVDFHRKNKHRGTSLDDAVGDEENQTLADTIADPGDMVTEIDRQYIKKNISLILDELDPKYKSILILKFLEDKDYEEISDILKKPPGTVATLIHRAKREFRKVAESKGYMKTQI